MEKIDWADLMGEVEELVAAIEDAEGRTATLHAAVEAIIARFREQLGIYGGRIYRRQGDEFVLLGVFGEAVEPRQGLVLSESYPPISMVLEERTMVMEADDPRLDRGLEDALGVQRFAAIEVGDQDYILAFNVEADRDRTEVLYALGILRSAINLRLSQERIEEVLREARKIQASIFPRRAPEFPGYDIYGRSQPMEIVGGDHFDFITLSDSFLGVAIADVSGHGLPAALLVRDIHTGLRMGLSKEFKITHTMERLNSIIHGSRLTSRFVSMFYGELERAGTLTYVNAGHPPPLFISKRGEQCSLLSGGAVLGPLSDVSYERGYATLRQGDVCVLFTDGIVEATGTVDGKTREDFGGNRLADVVRAHLEAPAKEIVQAIFASVEHFCGTDRLDDDRTVVVIKRLPGFGEV
jgi:sigma-B regulation protein RsbU (phosphoserine phosphatase)